MESIPAAFRLVLCDYLGEDARPIADAATRLRGFDPAFVFDYLRHRAAAVAEPARTELLREVAALLELEDGHPESEDD